MDENDNDNDNDNESRTIVRRRKQRLFFKGVGGRVNK